MPAVLVVGSLIGVLIWIDRGSEKEQLPEVVRVPGLGGEALAFIDGRTLVAAARPASLIVRKFDRLPMRSSLDVRIPDEVSLPWPKIHQDRPRSLGLGVRDMAVGPGGRTIAVAGNAGPTPERKEKLWGGVTLPTGGLPYGVARLWDTGARKWGAAWPAYEQSANAIDISPDGRLVAIGAETLEIREAATGRLVRDGSSFQRDGAPDSPITRAFHVAFSPDGRTVAAGSVREVMLNDLVTGRAAPLNSAPMVQECAEALAFSPDGRLLATVGQGILRLSDTRTRTPVADLTAGDGNMVAFSPDGRFLVTVSNVHGTARLWNVATRRQIAVFPSPPGGLGSLAFSPDGTTVALSSTSPSVLMWNVTRYTRPR
ncbi:WD40 repeat domain-containing protein [Actinomadura sp. 21ATH]|uniref:WD40 repeat domain-containing protein n=1 Tax=Actinomadura sp. 21ATH TaxID=1735444 RepID=UPI0035C15F23